MIMSVENVLFFDNSTQEVFEKNNGLWDVHCSENTDSSKMRLFIFNLFQGARYTHICLQLPKK